MTGTPDRNRIGGERKRSLELRPRGEVGFDYADRGYAAAGRLATTGYDQWLGAATGIGETGWKRCTR